MAEVATGSGSTTLYLQINSNGRLYHKASAEEEQTFKDRKEENSNYNGSDIGVAEIFNSKTGVTYYHKQYSRTAFGKVVWIDIHNAKFDGREIPMFRVAIKPEEGGRECVSAPLYNSTGTGLNQIVKGIITLLPNLDVTADYAIAASRKEYTRADGTPNYNISVFFNFENESGEQDFIRSAISYRSETNPDGEIPPAEKVKKLGKESWDFSKQDEYLLEVLNEQIARIKSELETLYPNSGGQGASQAQVTTPQSPVSQTSDTAKQKKNVVPPASNIQKPEPPSFDDSDLPF